MPKYVIANTELKTQRSVIKHVQSILSRYSYGDHLGPSDHAFIYDMLQGHHHADKKIGPGIKSITKILNGYGQHAFQLHRIDGTTTDFSYMKCLSPPKKNREIKEACRNAVYRDKVKYKKQYFRKHGDAHNRIRCRYTGTKVTWSESQVHHSPPHTFDYIVRRWQADRGFKTDSIQLDGYGDGKTAKRFQDKRIEQDFRIYHKGIAKLAIVSTKWHQTHRNKQAGTLEKLLYRPT